MSAPVGLASRGRCGRPGAILPLVLALGGARAEFTQVRSQYRRTAFGDDRAANELLLQVLFTIGAHGARPF